MCAHINDHCNIFQATTFKCSTWWSCMGTGEHLTDTGDYLCAIPTLLLNWKHRISVLEIERHSFRISDLAWSSQDQHGQYYNVCLYQRPLHLFPSHCVQVVNIIYLHGNWWASLWPGRWPVLRVRYRHCFSGEKVWTVWPRWKGIYFDSQIWNDRHIISMSSIMTGYRVHDPCIFIEDTNLNNSNMMELHKNW